MKWVNGGVLALNVLLAGALIFWWCRFGAITIVPGGWSYNDLVSVLLTVVTVVLAFIGLIVGGAAIWGYQSIRSIAEQKAEATSKAGFDAYLASPVFRANIETAIKEVTQSIARDAVQDALAPAVLLAEENAEHQMPEGNRQNLAQDEREKMGDEKWED